MRKPAGLIQTTPAMMLLLAGIAAPLVPSTPAYAVEVIAPFDWSMPPRLIENTNVPDRDPASPIPQYVPAAQMLPSNGWTVDFDACMVTTSTITQYDWTVDGVPVGSVTDCLFTHVFPVLGIYQVSLTITDDAGIPATLEQTVTVQDWLIVAVGDSYGSGEGNPD